MTDKVRTAVFGKDLRVEIKKYPLSKAGNKIDINHGGEGYFMPEIGPNQFLDWPVRKRFLLFGPWVYVRTFFSVKLGTKCIDFSLESPEAYGPDIEQLKEANAALLAKKIGQNPEIKIPWYFVVLLVLILVLVAINSRALGVF